MIEFDTSEVRQLVRDLGHAPGRVVPEVTAVVNRGALNIKKDWQRRWTGLSHLPRLAATINYDMKFGIGTIGAEIGADKSKTQGPLANIAEFGTVKNAPHPGGGPALKAEEPKFVNALADVLEKSLS